MAIDLDRVRGEFPALENVVWFQNGGVSITPLPVAREHAERMQELLERGPMHIAFPQEEYPRRAHSMEVLANFFSCDVGELALMRGVTAKVDVRVAALLLQRVHQLADAGDQFAGTRQILQEIGRAHV